MESLNSSGAKVDNTDGITGDESGFNALNITDNDEHTALHLACNNGHFHIVSYLCTHDADLEAWYVAIASSIIFLSIQVATICILWIFRGETFLKFS